MPSDRAEGTERKSKLPVVLGTALLIALGTALGFILSEAAYRAALYGLIAPERFARATTGSFAVNDKPMWRYDERFGYVYPRGEQIHIAGVTGGRVTACSWYPKFNEEGNVGRIVGDYASAEVKILAFGDSFTAISHDGVTWPLLLQEALGKRTGRSVNVVNYGRDGTGILQMFDIAAAKVGERKPDLAIIAFITNDLQRVRFWRAPVQMDGRWRLLVSPEPTPNPDPAKSYDTAIFHPEATADWCQKMKASGARDQVLEEAEDVYRRGIGIGERRVPSILTLRHLYLLARVRHGDPFHGVGEAFSFPVIQYASYAEDARFVESLRTLEASGIPYVLMHLPIYPELKAGREYILTNQEARLLKSLAQVTGKPIYETTRYTKMPVEKPERLINAEDDHHPSLAGLQFYADAIAEILVRSGFVK